MAFDDYADNHSVPPKSCRPQAVRENLPQSFHSLAVSEPDPITLFTPYILFCSLPEQRPCHQPTCSTRDFPTPPIFPEKAVNLNLPAISPPASFATLRPPEA